MIAFHFRLERALAWRNTELIREEARLEQLQAELRSIEVAATNVRQRRAEAQSAVARAPVVVGSELATLEWVRVWAVAEDARLSRQAAISRQGIAQQKQSVAVARRHVRLLERLKERRHAEWKIQADRELDDLASEAAIMQWRRKTHV